MIQKPKFSHYAFGIASLSILSLAAFFLFLIGLQATDYVVTQVQQFFMQANSYATQLSHY